MTFPNTVLNIAYCTHIKWVISFGMGLIILLMTLYRFLKLTPMP
jgi:hypothetical protein